MTITSIRKYLHRLPSISIWKNFLKFSGVGEKEQAWEYFSFFSMEDRPRLPFFAHAREFQKICPYRNAWQTVYYFNFSLNNIYLQVLNAFVWATKLPFSDFRNAQIFRIEKRIALNKFWLKYQNNGSKRDTNSIWTKWM